MVVMVKVMLHMALITLGLVLPQCFTDVQGKRILLIPLPFPSHIRQLVIIGEALVSKGHDAHILLSERTPMMYQFSQGQLKIITHTAPLVDVLQLPPEHHKDFLNILMSHEAITDVFRIKPDLAENMVKNMLLDDDALNEMQRLRFDLAIVDMDPAARPFLLMPYLLDVPFVTYATYIDPWLSRMPALPSFVPLNMAKGAYSDKMSFLERLDNTMDSLRWTAFPRVTFLDDTFVNQFIRDKPPVKLNKLAGQSLLWLLNIDNVLDYPKPQMSNEILVGGISAMPANKLPPDLEDFVSSAKEGFILMSFGSLGRNMDEKIINKFVETFRTLGSQKILWAYTEDKSDVSDNVKTMNWLPQNDLLGHANIKLLITHCGANSQYEALYHGVTMIGFPLFADQKYNCQRTLHHGFGVCLDIRTFTPEDLILAIHEISTNSSYKKAISAASEVFRNSPMTPLERSVFWIEHVLRFGSSHLRSAALDMPWYEYLMLDILLVLGIMGLAGVLMVVIFIYCLYRTITKQMEKNKQD